MLCRLVISQRCHEPICCAHCWSLHCSVLSLAPLNGDTAFGGKGGTLQLYGWKSGPSWTTPSAAKASDTPVRLTASWKSGDTIVIVKRVHLMQDDILTESRPEQPETLTITSVS
ncbi:hypothetical protein PROFUN_03204 [Planoprotostelium fungivorum]|uniref:Uncharacterized protein n=1 Tax=Planoprotostelium fungivorum TaxID=1890364 RepID=A0A2P6NX06_9EUKA|nr:hypothetical protein PROFUN_03204 [Planoprotostelium fungivorum]